MWEGIGKLRSGAHDHDSTPMLRDYAARLQAYRQTASVRGRTTAGADVRELSERPLLTVITVAFNAGAMLERTIQSVLSQSYPHVEYVIIDGGSSDGTVDIIRKYESRLSYWHSARDQGISDAFNLGIAASHGRYVALVNADDWMSENQGAVAVAALERSAAAFVFGRLAFHDQAGSLLYEMDGDPAYWRTIRRGMPHINHPTVVTARASYELVGMFDVRKRVAMDYHWHLRAERCGLRGLYVPALLGHMSVGGACFRDWAGGLREVRDSAVEIGEPPGRVFAHYALRLVRGRVREALYAVLPASAMSRLHRRINPNYRPGDEPRPVRRTTDDPRSSQSRE